MEKSDSQTTNPKDKRPKVTVSALTANSCEVLIENESGNTRLVCTHEVIFIDANGGKIEVHP